MSEMNEGVKSSSKYCAICKVVVANPKQILDTCEEFGMVLCAECAVNYRLGVRDCEDFPVVPVNVEEKGKSDTLDMDAIKKYICPSATDKEACMFLQLCKHRNLNPFLNEVYLIKYGNADATIVVGKDAFLKRAEEHPQFDGLEAGVIVETVGRIPGAFVGKDERLVGGWAMVHRKDRNHPAEVTVSLDEYIGKKRDGTITKMWREKPATMIRKVAIVQALREAFPSDLAGMYDSSEMGV